MRRLKQAIQSVLIGVGLLLLVQCDQKEDEPTAASKGDGEQQGASPSNRNPSETGPKAGDTGSGPAEGGSGVSTRIVPPPTPGDGGLASEELGSPEWQKKMDGLKLHMKDAIAGNDEKALINGFQSAVELQGGSFSSSIVVFSELVPDLSANLEMGRDLVDSMDREKMSPGASASELALTIEDKEERTRWVESLADPEVRDEVLQSLSGQ